MSGEKGCDRHSDSLTCLALLTLTPPSVAFAARTSFFDRMIIICYAQASTLRRLPC
ncbi:hypothetical protein BN2497_8909 [Janthinobacterium sp. CG23_2]|nr:hypothetical protein BN2497_8909 [Janthinobacterium sp. CG23_2]CUU30852.1 hypothetical protein BN3177_8909 [Janthinobacterium sp. CG23_2]